jgi:outer membrane protein assembly factor BamA
MRGWRARTLGPGKYVDTVSQNYVNQTGDIRLEFNAEYRFNVWSYFKGVLFTDIGNIWLMKPDKIRPGAEFLFNSFYKQFAIDAGTGIRFDYKGYFLIRFDIGFPLVNPALSKNEKWLGNEIKLQSMQWRKDNLKYNLAVGYPF